MIQTVVNAIDANIKSKITSNIKCYGLCSEVERESQDGNGANRYLIDSEGNAAVTDDNFEVGSAHILTTTNCEYRNNAFDILEIAEMQLLVWITNGLYNQHDIYRQFRDVIFATEVKNELAKNIQLIPIDLNLIEFGLMGINWVIVGAETGKNSRPCELEWVTHIQNECKERNIPFFFKQWTKFNKLLNGELVQMLPDDVYLDDNY